MQHPALSTLSWSEGQQVYVLAATARREALRMRSETAAWFAWLNEVSSFAFHGQHGSFSARKEARKRGSGYWYAYRKREGVLAKKYLGKTADLTFSHLEEIAGALDQDRTTAIPMPEPASLALVQPETPLQAPALFSAREKLPVPFLATRLSPPRLRARLVSRVHLVERLQQGVAGPLTLVSAPAGFGKTTLLAQWRAATRAPVAWLSLEPEDNQPARFLASLIAAVQTLDPLSGVYAQALLGHPQPAEPDTVLALLLNDLLHWQGEDFVLVLDDYHVITVEPIHQALVYLVEHLPPRMHLLLSTRGDPPLPLARWRARGQLAELRAAELRFEIAETGAFLTEVMDLRLSPDDVLTLQSRTEGWIAGLQLAALSLQSRADIAGALLAFTGSHRFVLDYLSEEVLSRQPEQVLTFLLQTSILERLSGSLCAAVTGRQESQAMLETLDRANLFVVALDDVREWYRYHPLFAELLRSRLSQLMPALLPDLHGRASGWYEEHGLILEAVHHAVLLPNLERTTHLLEAHRHSLALHGQAHAALTWLQTLPDELMQRNPSLCLSQGLLLLLTGQLPEAFTRLQMAEQSARYIVEEREAQAFLYQVAALQAFVLFFQGDLASSVKLAEQALDHLTHCPVEVQESARLIAAHSVLLSGDVSQSGVQRVTSLVFQRLLRDDMAAMDLLLRLTCLLLEARLLQLQGRLRSAAALYEQMASFEGAHKRALIFPGSCFGLGELAYAWNDLDRAERLLEQGKEALRGPLALAADAIARGYATLALLYQARRRSASALGVIEEFIRLAETRQFASTQLAAARAVRARLALMQGQLAESVSWAESSSLPEAYNPCYACEQEYLTFVRVRIAQGRLDPAGPYLGEALRLLENLLKDADAKGRVDSLLEILVLQALALFANPAHKAQAFPVLERALRLAESEGCVRLFIDEGEPMAALLRQAHAREIVPAFVATLLQAFTGATVTAPSQASVLIEPLTERELAVFRLLVKGLSNAEIARELIIVVGTVKRHVNSIYGKLGVQSRAQAIARAQALRLL